MLKTSKENKKLTLKGFPIRIKAYLSIETLQTRKEWQDILKVMKEENQQPRLLDPSRISFKHEGENKTLQRSKSSEYSASPNQLSNKC